MRLPLTLAIIEGFGVDVGGDTYLLPLHAVRDCLTLPSEERGKGAFGVIDLRGGPLPYIRLRHHFEIDRPPAVRENIVVVAGNGIRAGFAVDVLHGPRQTVIKPLGKRFQRVRGISGSAILGDGRVALILDVVGLLRDVMQRTADNSGTAAVLLRENF
jgi:two-component system chemotaxis sensor kinase CheA